MEKHKHEECMHKKGLQYCEKCDVAYCNDCSKEWKNCSHASWTYYRTDTALPLVVTDAPLADYMGGAVTTTNTYHPHA